MSPTSGALAALILTACVVTVYPQAPVPAAPVARATVADAEGPVPDPASVPFTLPKDIKWTGEVGRQQSAILYGDPQKAGPYGVIYRWYPGNFSRPHFHDQTRWIYVVSGTWWISTSTVFDERTTYPMHAGTAVVNEAGKVHWDGARSGEREPAVLVLTGIGPVKTTQVDASGKPLPPAVAAQVTPAPSQLPNPYRLDDSFRLELPKGIAALGSVSGLKVGPDNNVYVFHRCAQDSCAGHDDINPILVFNPQGRLQRALGAGQFNWPHGLLVMPDRTLWATDAGVLPEANGQRGKGSQVFKMNRDGRITLAIGKPGVAAIGRDTLNRPSDVLIGRNGDIFVADGHSGGGTRVIKFNSKGEYVTDCGATGAGPGQTGQPHSLAVDSQGRLFVADRTNNRINIYDQDCTFLTEWRQFGRPSSIAIDRNDTLYVVDTQTTSGRAGFENGIYIGSAKDGKVTGFIPKVGARSFWEVLPVPAAGTASIPDATNMESIAVAADGSAIYGGEVGMKTVVKFVRK